MLSCTKDAREVPNVGVLRHKGIIVLEDCADPAARCRAQVQASQLVPAACSPQSTSCTVSQTPKRGHAFPDPHLAGTAFELPCLGKMPANGHCGMGGWGGAPTQLSLVLALRKTIPDRESVGYCQSECLC